MYTFETHKYFPHKTLKTRHDLKVWMLFEFSTWKLNIFFFLSSRSVQSIKDSYYSNNNWSYGFYVSFILFFFCLNFCFANSWRHIYMKINIINLFEILINSCLGNYKAFQDLYMWFLWFAFEGLKIFFLIMCTGSYL